MAKASMKLSDGTTVVVEGSVEEIQKILALHRPSETSEFKAGEIKKAGTRKPKHQDKPSEAIDLTALINVAKEAEEFGLIEKNILERSSQVDRILIPLYFAHKHNPETALTSGEISKFLAEFGVNVAQPNVAKTLSTIAVKYVKGDKLRKQGQAVRYRLSGPGNQYITVVIQGKSNE